MHCGDSGPRTHHGPRERSPPPQPPPPCQPASPSSFTQHTWSASMGTLFKGKGAGSLHRTSVRTGQMQREGRHGPIRGFFKRWIKDACVDYMDRVSRETALLRQNEKEMPAIQAQRYTAIQ